MPYEVSHSQKLATGRFLHRIDDGTIIIAIVPNELQKSLHSISPSQFARLQRGACPHRDDVEKSGGFKQAGAKIDTLTGT